jgi:hypothetical protein
MKARGANGRHKIMIQISYGELLDKITILEIKALKCHNSEQLQRINSELQSLLKVYRDNYVGETANLMEQLRIINQRLWYLEDQIRLLALSENIGQEFIDVARDICKKNDERANIKRTINQITNSQVVEEKIYDVINKMIADSSYEAKDV